MQTHYNILIMGATYGSLLATKLLLAGHRVKLVCLPAEAEIINAQGTLVRMPAKGREGLVAIRSPDLPGKLSAGGTDDVDPNEYDLIALAMQEPQYRLDGVRQLLDAVAKSGVPCMSIMNMPPLPYLRRIPGLDADSLTHCYADPSVWENFDPARLTLASPDPQAFRPPEDAANVLQVSLPTNFKVARFDGDAHTKILHDLEAGIDAVRFDTGDGAQLELPVKIRVHDSVFVPLAKWCMLLTGNYRCVQADEMRSIKDSVHSDLDRSRAVYEWVAQLCRSLGASPADQVPFEKYARAAESLVKPSSAARALAGGAPYIERVDRLVQSIAASRGESLAEIDEVVSLVEQWLTKNRS